MNAGGQTRADLDNGSSADPTRSTSARRSREAHVHLAGRARRDRPRTRMNEVPQFRIWHGLIVFTAFTAVNVGLWIWAQEAQPRRRADVPLSPEDAASACVADTSQAPAQIRGLLETGDGLLDPRVSQAVLLCLHEDPHGDVSQWHALLAVRRVIGAGDARPAPTSAETPHDDHAALADAERALAAYLKARE